MKPVVSRKFGCIVALGALFACATGTPYAQVAAQLPTLPARVRSHHGVHDDQHRGAHVPTPDIAIDGREVGKIATGTFFHVEMPAGVHQVGVKTDEHLAGFGNQGGTQPVEIEVASGTTSYVQVGVLVTVGMLKVVLTPEPAADAQRDLSNLYQVAPVPQ